MGSDKAAEILLSPTSSLGDVECHEAAAEYRRRDPLVNDSVPNQDYTERSPANSLRKRESLACRSAALMRANGYTAQEIAEALNRTVTGIYALLQQPWARQRMLEAIHARHSNALAMLEAEVANNINFLAQLRDDDEQPAAARRAAASDLLDRYLGKATQVVSLERRDVPASVEDAERRLAVLKAEEVRLKGN